LPTVDPMNRVRMVCLPSCGGVLPARRSPQRVTTPRVCTSPRWVETGIHSRFPLRGAAAHSAWARASDTLVRRIRSSRTSRPRNRAAPGRDYGWPSSPQNAPAHRRTPQFGTDSGILLPCGGVLKPQLPRRTLRDAGSLDRRAADPSCCLRFLPRGRARVHPAAEQSRTTTGRRRPSPSDSSAQYSANLRVWLAGVEKCVRQRYEASGGQDDAAAPRPARALCTAAMSSDIRNGLLMKAAAPSPSARV